MSLSEELPVRAILREKADLRWVNDEAQWSVPEVEVYSKERDLCRQRIWIEPLWFEHGERKGQASQRI